MKTIQSKVSYRVPHWNFCNVDRFDFDATPSKQTCRFCVKAKSGHTCLLYDKPLSVTDGQISKTRECCKATAGFASVIEEPTTAPTIPPKDLMKQTIELYSKTVNDLLVQGYPRPMAEMAAKKYILDPK